jgi:hypothetical protein
VENGADQPLRRALHVLSRRRASSGGDSIGRLVGQDSGAPCSSATTGTIVYSPNRSAISRNRQNALAS